MTGSELANGKHGNDTMFANNLVIIFGALTRLLWITNACRPNNAVVDSSVRVLTILKKGVRGNVLRQFYEVPL